MERAPNRMLRKKVLLSIVILLLAVPAVVLLKPGTPTLTDAAQKAPAEKEKCPKMSKVVLRSTLGDREWYEADVKDLSKQIDEFYQKAEVKPINDVIAMILPHAGYQYSGQTAVRAIKTTDKRYSRIVVIGPSHRTYMEEMLSVPSVTHYETLLGEIPLDLDFIEKLLKYPMFHSVPYAHTEEHSVQIELPLLQYKQKDFKLVPIVAGHCSLETIRKAGSILKSMVDEQTLVIASSDFVHYGPRFRYVPFRKNVAEQIRKTDMGAYKYIANLDSGGFVKYKQKTGATICGSVPVAILLSMLEKPAEANLIEYKTSGELTGSYTNSVSYLSVVFSGQWPSRPARGPESISTKLSQEDKKQLLTLARKTIVQYLQNKRVPAPSELGVKISGAMRAPRAAFVTLNKVPDSQETPGPLKPMLRGCIGDIFPRRPLYKSVIGNAINAAVNDRRFPPVSIAECNDITIEISALTSPKPIESANDIRVGIDGVVLSKNGRSAVYLPQVAPEQGWDVEQMLTNLSLKAKLPKDAWKEGASFLVFQAVVFGEEE
jgi:AmmeMemoRadiSam system protein B/AmmeMemoRadiSam system protein A